MILLETTFILGTVATEELEGKARIRGLTMW
jgi:hypothetical protein